MTCVIFTDWTIICWYIAFVVFRISRDISLTSKENTRTQKYFTSRLIQRTFY